MLKRYGLLGVLYAIAFVALMFGTSAKAVQPYLIEIVAITDAAEGANNGPGTPAQYDIRLKFNNTNTEGVPITGNIAYSGTATQGTDYPTGPTTFTIGPGQNSVSVFLPGSPDNIVEPTENITLTISGVNIGTIEGDVATALLTNEDVYEIYISNEQIGSENNGGATTPAQVEVFIGGETINNEAAPITGALTYTGTATDGSDYTGTTSYSIPVGANDVIVDIPVLEDVIDEGSETVIVTLGSPSIGTNGPDGFATTNITDDDSTAYTLSITKTTDGAEDRFTAPTDVQFTVTSSAVNTSGAPITGDIFFSGTASPGLDYVASPTSFSIPVGQDTATFTLTVIEDKHIELTETVIASIANLSAGLIGTGSATANITDEDLANLQINIIVVTHGEEKGAGVAIPVAFTVSVDSGGRNFTGVPITGTMVIGGTATNEVDYTGQVTSFAIPVGEASVRYDFPILDDLLSEPVETVTAEVTNPSVGVPNPTTNMATAELRDDDAAVSAVYVEEHGTENSFGSPTNTVFRVELEGGIINSSFAPITGDIVFTGAATSGTDYVAGPVQYSIPDGANSSLITLAVIEDADVEGPETIIATVSNPSRGIASTTNNVATANLGDDDAPVTVTQATIASDNSIPTLAKKDDTITLMFTSSGPLRDPVVTIAGKPAVITGGPLNWKATRLLDGTEPEGIATFTVNGTNNPGVPMTEVVSTTDNSEVVIDFTPPDTKKPTTPTDGGSGTNPMTVTGACPDAPNGTVKFWTTPTGGITPAMQTHPLNTDGSYSVSIQWSDPSSTTAYTLHTQCTDAAGNIGDTEDTTGIVIDRSVDAVQQSFEIYRFWSHAYRSHFYTIDEYERDYVIEAYDDATWIYEGVALYGYRSSAVDRLPVYRFWSHTNKRHFYTISESEKASTVADPAWNYEGIDWYTDATDSTGSGLVHRLWSPTYKTHFYALGEYEKDYTLKHDAANWRYEGIAWNGPMEKR